MEMQRQFSDCFLWIEEEVNSPKIKSQLSVGGISQLCGAPIESLDFIKVWISKFMRMYMINIAKNTHLAKHRLYPTSL